MNSDRATDFKINAVSQIQEMKVPSRSVIFRNSITEFLDHLLYQASTATILLVCSTRRQFLDGLYADCYLQSPVQADAAFQQGSTHDEHPNNGQVVKTRELWSQTIGLLAKSSRIRLVFCPTLEHVRAWLATLHTPLARKADAAEQPTGQSSLAIVNILAAHRVTCEFSAQGLSRSLALLVETASLTGMDVVLCECDDPTNPRNIESGEKLWHVNVPILTNSIPMGIDERPFSGRGVPVKTVVQRWFEWKENARSTNGLSTD